MVVNCLDELRRQMLKVSNGQTLQPWWVSAALVSLCSHGEYLNNCYSVSKYHNHDSVVRISQCSQLINLRVNVLLNARFLLRGVQGCSVQSTCLSAQSVTVVVIVVSGNCFKVMWQLGGLECMWLFSILISNQANTLKSTVASLTCSCWLLRIFTGTGNHIC